MSKYKKEVLEVLSEDEIKSTNEVLIDLQNKVNKIINWHMLHRILRDLEDEGKVERLRAKADKVINWHALYRVLMELQSEGKIERLKAKAGFFWKKK
tara:strand:- start:2682 stop:2972 length:291 start_codon:yes stop_codon:yes gene_type:complete